MSEWDPWKRYEREFWRRYDDPWYRYDYERDRLSWDPWYRAEKERERMQWDPYYRTEKMIEKKYSDPEYRWRRYEERRMSGDWYEAYLENPRDPLVRERYMTITYNDIELPVHPRLSRKDLEVIGFVEMVSRVNRLLNPSVLDYIKVGFSIGFIGLILWWIFSFL